MKGSINFSLCCLFCLVSPSPFLRCQPVGQQLPSAAKASADFAKYHPLGLDLKVRARLTVVAVNPKLQNLLDSLATATGLSLTLADNLTDHNPALGDIHLKDTFAYSFMEIIAERDLEGGRWVKTDDGYRLEGVSRALRPQARQFPWSWVLATLGLLLLAAATFVIYRGRGAKAPANPSK